MVCRQVNVCASAVPARDINHTCMQRSHIASSFTPWAGTALRRVVFAHSPRQGRPLEEQVASSQPQQGLPPKRSLACSQAAAGCAQEGINQSTHQARRHAAQEGVMSGVRFVVQWVKGRMRGEGPARMQLALPLAGLMTQPGRAAVRPARPWSARCLLTTATPLASQAGGACTHTCAPATKHLHGQAGQPLVLVVLALKLLACTKQQEQHKCRRRAAAGGASLQLL